MTYSIILDGREIRSESPMHVSNVPTADPDPDPDPREWTFYLTHVAETGDYVASLDRRSTGDEWTWENPTLASVLADVHRIIAQAVEGCPSGHRDHIFVNDDTRECAVCGLRYHALTCDLDDDCSC